MTDYSACCVRCGQRCDPEDMLCPGCKWLLLGQMLLTEDVSEIPDPAQVGREIFEDD